MVAFFHGLPTIVVRSFTIVPKNDRNDRKISYYDRRQPVFFIPWFVLVYIYFIKYVNTGEHRPNTDYSVLPFLDAKVNSIIPFEKER